MMDLLLSRRAFLQGAAAALLAPTARAGGGDVYPAAAFARSVGVNTHMSSEPYASRYSRVRDLLHASNIRHLRDELRPRNDLNPWRDLFGRYAIRSHLLVSPATNTVTQMLDYIAALGVEKISAIEGQNEGDSDWFKSQKAARRDWSAAVVAYQREVFQALRARYKAAELPIVSPSVLDWKPGDMPLIRGAADFCDIVAIHSYTQHAEEPETASRYAAVSWYLQNMRDRFKPGAPVMATETGYNNMVRPGGSGVSETAAAIYIPRLLLNNFAAGVQRTFLYQLLDGGADPDEWEDHWGLVRHDDTPKPAFHAIAALLGALSDEGGATQKPVEPLRVAIAEAPPEVRLLQFRKLDGSIVLAIWRAVPCWDAQKAAGIAVSPQPLTVVLDRPVLKAATMTPNDGASWTELAVSGGGIVVPVVDKVVLVRLT